MGETETERGVREGETVKELDREKECLDGVWREENREG